MPSTTIDHAAVGKRKLAELLSTRVLENIAALTPARVLDGQPNAARATTRTRFPWIEFYGNEPMVGGLAGHRHHHVELATVLDGRLYLGIDHCLYEAWRGDWMVLRPDVLHGESCLRQRGAYSLLWFVLSDNELRCHTTRYARRGGYELLASMRPHPMGRDLQQAAHRLVTEPWRSIATARRQLLRMTSWCLEQMTQEAARAPAAHPRVVEVERMIRRRLDRPPTVVELANQIGLSPNYLSSLFHQQTGQTLRDFVDRTRIDEACRRLTDRDRRVKQVAYELGFADPHHFSRVFRRVMGEPPSAYQHRLAEEADT